MVLEFDLHLGLEPPSSWPSTSRTTREGAEEATGESGLRCSVLPARRRLLNQLAGNDLVETRRIW